MPKTPTARDRWVAENTTRVAIKLNHHTDADILAMLAAAESKAGLIKKALRAYKEETQAEQRGEGTMKQYTVKPEYQDAWFGGLPTDEIGDAIVSEEEINRLAREWGMTVDELMEQVEEC